MEINFEEDIRVLTKKLKNSYLFLAITILFLISCNILLIIFSNYQSQKTFKIILGVSDLIFALLIYYIISLYLLRYKNLKSFLMKLCEITLTSHSGIIINVSKPYLYRKGIYASEVTINENGSTLNYLIFPDLYDYNKIKENSYVSFSSKDNVIVKVG